MRNYENNLEKREIQKKIFPLINRRKMIALAGPNLANYLSIIPNRVKDIQVYEKDKKVMTVQLPQLPKVARNVSYHFTDVIYADVKKDTFYDLDFCCSVKGAERHIRRFKDCAFTITLSLRPTGLEETLEKFFKACEEKIVENIPTRFYNLIKTNKSKYLYISYSDGWPMVTIFKFH